MPYIINEKIRIGVSACNFGARVRYNRKGWDRISPLEREKDAFIFTPVCPEVLSGLGVPREPMRLAGGNGDAFWSGEAKAKNKRGYDVSAQLKDGALSALDNLHRAGVEAFIFMDGSPSCGVYRTTLKDKRLGKPPGIFGSLLLKENLFLIPALDLDSPLKWWDWRRRLHAFIWIKRAVLGSKQELYGIWHDFKFLCQELDRPAADKMGSRIGSIAGRFTQADREEIRALILDILRKPTTARRIRGSAEKQTAFFCKRLNLCYSEKFPDSEKGKKLFLERLLDMEKKSVSENINYGLMPVVFREKRNA